VQGVYIPAGGVPGGGNSKEDDGAAAIETRESDAVRQASVGGLERDESGIIKQTYTGESPKACAT